MHTGIKICCRPVQETALACGGFSRSLYLFLLAFREKNGRMGFDVEESARSFLQSLFSGAMLWNAEDARWVRLGGEVSTIPSIRRLPMVVLQPTEPCLHEMRSLEQYRTKVKKNEFRQRLGKTPVSVETPLLAGLLNTPVVIHATAIEFLASHSIAVVKFGLSEYGLYFRAICSTRNEFQALIGVCAEKYNIETEDIEDEKLMPAW